MTLMYSVQAIGGLARALTMCKMGIELLISQARGSLCSLTVLPGHEKIYVLVARLEPVLTVVHIGPLSQCKVFLLRT